MVFVSHNMRAIRTLCSRVLMLKSGRLVLDGSTNEVVNQYEADSGCERREQFWSEADAPGDRSLRLTGARVEAVSATTRISPLTPFEIAVFVNSLSPEQHVTVSLQVCDAARVPRFITSAAPVLLNRRLHEFRCQIPGRLLNDGVHLIDVLLHRDGTNPVVQQAGVLNLDLVPDAGPDGITRQVAGAVRPLLDWKIVEEGGNSGLQPLPGNERPKST